MKRSIIMAVAVALCLALCACGQTSAASNSEASSSSTSSSSAEANPFVGTWEVVSQEKVHNEDLEEEKEAGRSRFFILGDDGSARAEYKGVAVTGTFKNNGDGSARLAIDDPTWGTAMTIENPLLVVESADGLRFRFEKVTDEDRTAYNGKFGYFPEG